MAPPSIVGAVLGGYLLGRCCPSRALLLAIAAVLLYSGIDLLRWQPPSRPRGERSRPPDLDIPRGGRDRRRDRRCSAGSSA